MMFLEGLNDIDQKIIALLIENARYTYSQIAEKLGLSRVAIKNHIDELEKKGVIEGYTTILNPQKMSDAISLYFDIETRPESFRDVVEILNSQDHITQLYRTTGDYHLHVHALLSSQDEMDSFLHDVMDQLPGIKHMTTNVILTRIKDIKGLRL